MVIVWYILNNDHFIYKFDRLHELFCVPSALQFTYTVPSFCLHSRLDFLELSTKRTILISPHIFYLPFLFSSGFVREYFGSIHSYIMFCLTTELIVISWWGLVVDLLEVHGTNPSLPDS